jgi:hypothetical protein
MTVREVKANFGLSSETAARVRDEAKRARKDPEGRERRKAKLRKILTQKQSANKGLLLALASGTSIRKAGEVFKKGRASISLTLAQMREYGSLMGMTARQVALAFA